MNLIFTSLKPTFRYRGVTYLTVPSGAASKACIRNRPCQSTKPRLNAKGSYMLIRLILAVLAAYLVLSAAYVILVILLIAGLLFRTKETLGLIGLYWAFRLFGTHPVATIAGILGLVVIGAMFSQKSRQQQSDGEPEQATESKILLLPPPRHEGEIP
jgi:hypothetical protein